jgi:uncharacterized oxidoreductase
MKITGNTILITGATSGLGLAFAEEFLKEGNTVIICGRRAERLAQIKEKHPAIITRVCDVADEQQRNELCRWAIENYPDLNILMNNAGIQLATDLTKPVDMPVVRSEIETNLIAPVHLGSLFAPHLATKPDAAIINISSGLAFAPIAFMPVYCATKAAIHSLTLSLRHQLRNTSVKVFEIAPPSTDTELGHQHRSDKTQSHGGIPISEFLSEAMEAIRTDRFEALVGQAKVMHANPDELFKRMNQH